MGRMIDIHTHILPEVDDGSQSWEETLKLCDTAEKIGISHTVATPHFIRGVYTKGLREGDKLLEELKTRLSEENIPLEVSLAAEIEPFPELVQWIEEGRLPLYPSKRHILIESPMYSSPSWLEDLLRDIITLGISPILGHPERSPIARTSLPENLVALGGELQLDAGSLLGLWGREVKGWAWRMVEKGWVKYMASDSHRIGIRDPNILKRAYGVLARKRGESVAKALTIQNPKRVITL